MKTWVKYPLAANVFGFVNVWKENRGLELSITLLCSQMCMVCITTKKYRLILRGSQTARMKQPDLIPPIPDYIDPDLWADFIKYCKTRVSTCSRFEEWYEKYPKKKGKVEARKHWKRKKLDPIADQIIADTVQRTAVEWTDPQFIPMASTYIFQERWEDEIAPSQKGNGSAVPKSDEAAIRWAAERGIEAKVGESMWDFRSRLEARA